MPYNTPATPFIEQMVTGLSATAGSQTGGVKSYLIAPFRGRVLEVGFMPTSLSSATAWTMAVSLGDNFASQTISNFTQIVTSTLGTFASQATFEGAVCSVVPATAAFVNRGDAIQFTHSGGATSAIGAVVYALLRRA
jgi:hypothetical protein